MRTLRTGDDAMRSTLPLFPTDDGWPYPDVRRREPAADDPDLDGLELFGPRAYATLSADERVALERRFGLDGATPCSMKELAARFGCTRAEAATLVGRAIDKMRTELQQE
jgi:hypothetical protein